MARHYSTTSFFRQVPNALLERYFRSKGLLAHVDFAAMSETKPEALLDAWLALPNDIRDPLEADFREVHEMCNERGFAAIRDEAQWQLREDPAELDQFITSLSALPDHCERAVITFLEHQRFWKGATRFHHADRLPYWRKRRHMEHRRAAVDRDSIVQLASLIGAYFHHTEGRGKNCVVEPLRRGDRDYFFAYPEDHAQRSLDWVNGEFEARPRNPAFEVVFVYSQREGSLDLNFRGSPKAIEALQGIFAQAVLKFDALPPDPKDDRVYDLEIMKRKDFEFTHEPGSGIEKVVVRKVRLSSRVTKGERLMVEASDGPQAVYNLVEAIGKSLPLHLYSVTQVELAVTVAGKAGDRAKVHTVRISHPNSCSLKYDAVDHKLRDMLEASGIEPRLPVADMPRAPLADMQAAA